MQLKSTLAASKALFIAGSLLIAAVTGAAEVRVSGVTCVDAISREQDGSGSTAFPPTHIRAWRGTIGVYNPAFGLNTIVACPIPDSSFLYPDAMRTIRLTGFDGTPAAAVSAFIYIAYAGGQGGKSLKKLYSGGTRTVGAETQPLDLTFTGKFDLNFVYYGQPTAERITSANRGDTKMIVAEIPPTSTPPVSSRVSELYFSTDYYFGT